MKEILAGGGLLAFLALIVLVLATILQPIFVIMICAQMKRTNRLLQRIERLSERPRHDALPNPLARNR